jgi:hypothetical protein
MMRPNLINGQHLIDSFMKLLPPSGESKKTHYYSGLSGKIGVEKIPQSVKDKLSNIFQWQPPENDWALKLFNGSTTMHNGDHSSADMALIGLLAKHGLTAYEADQVFRASGLYRPKWDELRGEQTYGEKTIGKAYNYRQFDESEEYAAKNSSDLSKFVFGSAKTYKPIYVPNGMPPRRFVGPQITDGVRLFPEKALSSLVALGAVGKTSILLSIACHIAAGKDWNDRPLQQQKVAMFFCEETREEISRKFSAITNGWTNDERSLAESNLIAIPLLGVDARLTAINKNQYLGSGITEKIISLLTDFNFKNGLVILDHMQGFTSGDLNLSETATAVCREVNKIVEATGAAVVLAAHISKGNINAKEVEQGFAVGSLAFENATRQMSGMITMPIEDAKKYGLEDTRKDYVRLALAKNSYGASNSGLWLRKIVSMKYHAPLFEPVSLSKPLAAGKLSELEKIGIQICSHLAKHPNLTRNQLDKISSIKGPLKASKAKVRESLDGLIATGRIKVYKVSESERSSLGLAKQVKEILRFNQGMTSSKSANERGINLGSADFKPTDDWD